MKFKYAATFLFLLLIFTGTAHSQAAIEFSVNLKPMLEDSSFVPGKDRIELIGNIPPLTLNRGYELTDMAPADSIYSVIIEFSPGFATQKLIYNFRIITSKGTLNETLPRSVAILNREQKLDALYFNAFAW